MNQNLRRLVLTLLVVALAASAGGCNAASPDSKSVKAPTTPKSSGTVTFRTAENAPEGFGNWEFSWALPKFDPDAGLEYVVTQPDGTEYFKWVKPAVWNPGPLQRSDFSPGFAGGDPKVFYSKQIRITFRATKGDLVFDPNAKYEFTFRKGEPTKESKGATIGIVAAVVDK